MPINPIGDMEYSGQFIDDDGFVISGDPADPKGLATFMLVAEDGKIDFGALKMIPDGNGNRTLFRIPMPVTNVDAAATMDEKFEGMRCPFCSEHPPDCVCSEDDAEFGAWAAEECPVCHTFRVSCTCETCTCRGAVCRCEFKGRDAPPVRYWQIVNEIDTFVGVVGEQHELGPALLVFREYQIDRHILSFSISRCTDWLYTHVKGEDHDMAFWADLDPEGVLATARFLAELVAKYSDVERFDPRNWQSPRC